MKLEQSTIALIKRHFTEIRRAVEEADKQIDRLIDSSVKQNALNYKKFNQEYLRQKTAELRQKAGEEALTIKADATQRTREAFAGIQLALKDWLLQPIPERFASVLNTIKSFDVPLEKEEIEALTELGAGNYLAGRILASVGEQFGIRDDFLPYRELERQLAAAQADCRTAISAYTGHLRDDNRYTAIEIGLPIAPDGMENWHVYAERFLESDTSLSRIEATLTNMTQTAFDLAPSKRAELDKLFGDASEEQRVRIASAMIDREDRLAALLPMYDAELYHTACAALDTALRERVLATMAAKADVDADTQAVIAELTKSEQRRATDRARDAQAAR